MTTLLTFATLFIKAGGTVLLTDFASGVLHWLEDSYGKASWPVVGKHVIQPNIDHHFFPRRFTKNSCLYRNNVTISIAVGTGLLLFVLGAWTIWWGIGLTIGAFANEIHCWAHRSPKENGRVIGFFQKVGLIQSPKHHAKHHTDPKNRTYCTITNYMNPLLDRLKVFQRAEILIEKFFGVGRRIDESVRHHHEVKPQEEKSQKVKGCSGKGCAACTQCQMMKRDHDRGPRTRRNQPRMEAVAGGVSRLPIDRSRATLR